MNFMKLWWNDSSLRMARLLCALNMPFLTMQKRIGVDQTQIS